MPSKKSKSLKSKKLIRKSKKTIKKSIKKIRKNMNGGALINIHVDLIPHHSVSVTLNNINSTITVSQLINTIIEAVKNTREYSLPEFLGENSFIRYILNINAGPQDYSDHFELYLSSGFNYTNINNFDMNLDQAGISANPRLLLQPNELGTSTTSRNTPEND